VEVGEGGRNGEKISGPIWDDQRGERMKHALLLVLLLLTGCAPEKVACKEIEMKGVPCTVCTHQNASGWYTSTPECHWEKASPHKA
jgi:hypothetical protein